MAAKIRKGDTVVILSGKDKGKDGEVIRSMPKDGKVLVKGVNMITRHTKPSQTDPDGGRRQAEAPLHVSKVAIKDAATGKPLRVGFRIEADGTKVRVAKQTGEVIRG